MILEPPEDLVRQIQRCLVDFFWSGQHWLKAPVLFLPMEGGQGLVDIRSRVKTFRLKVDQRLLYGKDVSWAAIACTLLRKAGNMGLDRHLFLMDIKKLDLGGLTLFYRSVLQAWTLVKISRESNNAHTLWQREEPLLFNFALNLDICKDIRSVRVATKILTQIIESLPQNYRLSLETHNGELNICDFPELNIATETENWEESEGGNLSFKTPQLGVFSNAGKKVLYTLCVKILHLNALTNVKESKRGVWTRCFPQGQLEDQNLCRESRRIKHNLIKLISHGINSHGFNTPKVLEPTFQSHGTAPRVCFGGTIIILVIQKMA